MNNFDYVCGSLVFPADFSGAVILYMDGDLEGVFRKKIFNILRPFHKAWTSAVEMLHPSSPTYSFTMEKVGEDISSLGTPRLSQTAFVKVVFPAPIGA